MKTEGGACMHAEQGIRLWGTTEARVAALENAVLKSAVTGPGHGGSFKRAKAQSCATIATSPKKERKLQE